MSPSSNLLLVDLSIALAREDDPALERALRATVGEVSTEEVDEALLQSYLFLGYPVALNAFARWREMQDDTAEAVTPEPPDWGAWTERGDLVCGRVYGGQYGRLRANVRKLHPDLERWMVTEGYGKVLGRSGLDLPTRELCIVAILAVRGWIRQLYSHLRGALQVGATAEEVEGVVDRVRSQVTLERASEISKCWTEVRDRRPAQPNPSPSTGGE